MKKVFVLLCFIVFVIFSSCEIGLGAQVDVEPPSVSLLSPNENARTRKTITFSGEWNDDLEVKEVSVLFKKTNDEKVQFGPYNAILFYSKADDKTSGLWECSVDPVSVKIPDGTYSILITATDTYNHSSSVSTVITVDNTAPFVVIDSPSTVSISTPMSYGQKFSIIGRGADEVNGGTIDAIDAVIYDDKHVEIARKSFSGISTSIDFIVAEWLEDGESFYKEIYGEDKEAGTKNYYLGLEVFDDARQVPAVEGDRGNSTNTIYLSNDLSLISGYKPSIAYSILNGGVSADSYPELADALNSKKVDKLTFSLNPVNNPYFQLQGYESLGDNPDLEVDSYGLMNKNSLTVNVYVGRDKNAILPQSIGVYLVPCDRNGKVQSNSKKITILEPGSIAADGSVTDKATLTSKFELFSSSCTWVSKSLNVEQIDGLSVGGYYLVEVVASDAAGVGIRNDSNYGVKITSTNVAPIVTVKSPGSSVQIASSKEFEITGTVKTPSKMSKIRLYKNSYNENKPDENYLNVELLVNEKSINSEEEIASVSSGLYLNVKETTPSLKFYNFKCISPKITDESYTIYIVAFDDSNLVSSKEISVDNDIYPPVFDSEPSITPLVYTNEQVYKVNGIVNISELISDNKKVKESWYSTGEFVDGKEPEWKSGDSGSTAGNLKFSIDTTQFADGSSKQILLKAMDSHGNVAYSGKDSNSVIILNIDQSTDAPQIVLSNTECGNSEDKNVILYDDNWGRNEYENAKKSEYRTVFGTSSNNIMLGSISDDDGIKNVVVRYKNIKLDKENIILDDVWTPIILDTKPDGKTTFSLKAKMPQSQGTYLIEIEVEDIFYDSSAPEKCKFNKTKVGPFLIAVDDGAPKLEIKTASDGFMTSSFTVEGTIDDETATITRFDNKECTGDGTPISHSGGKWTDEVKLTVEGENAGTSKKYEYCYKAVDDYNQETLKIFSFNYDPVPPTFKITKVKGESVTEDVLTAVGGLKTYGTADSSSYYVIEGTVSDIENADDDGVSGFNGGNIYYYIAEANGEKPETNGSSYNINDSTKWKTGRITPTDNNGYNGNWNISINFKSELDSNQNSENSGSGNSIDGKTYLIYLAAKDAAGNVSKIKDNNSCCIYVTIDSKPPVISNVNVEPGKDLTKISADISENVLLKKDNCVAVYNNGSIVECEPIILNEKKNLENNGNVVENGTASIEENAAGGKKYEVSISLKNVPVGKNSYTIEVIDDAGNKAVSSPILIDNIAPVISSKNSGIADGAYKTEKEGKSYEYITGAISTSATVSCSGTNNKLESVTWKDEYKKDETATDVVAEILSSGSCMPDGSGKITIEAVADEKLADYENKYVTRTVTATNIFGESTEWSYNFILDKTAPQINASEIKLGDVEYSQIAEKWYKTDTLKLSGTVTEEGSGVNKIDYELNKGGNLGNLRGTIYTTDIGNKETFESIISGFDEETEGSGANSLKLTVSDKAGNKANVLPMPKINIDMTAPKLTKTAAPQEQNSETSAVWYRFVEENGEASGNSGWKKYNNSILTNKTKAIELAGGFEDKNGDSRQSGVSEICVKIGEKQIPAKVYSKNEEGKWEIPADKKTGFEKGTDGSGPKGGVWIAKIEAENLTERDGTKSAVISIKDYAGNAGNTVAVNFLVDTEAPETLIEMPSAEAKLNGKVTFSGKVNDSNDVKSIQIYYAKGENCPGYFDGFSLISSCSKDTDSSDVSMSDITAWKFTGINVNELLSERETSSTVYLLPVAYDVAGNCSISGAAKLTADTIVQENQLTKVQIDLNSDRPIVKINNLSGSDENCYVTSNNLNISVEDDDGIKEVKFTFDEHGDWSSAQTVTLSSGSGTIPLGADGKKFLYLKIIDTQGGEFTTGANQIYQPYIKYSDSNDEMSDNSSAIKFHKDTAVPDFDAFYFGIGEDKESDFSKVRKELKSSSKAGGNRGKFVVFEVEANDGGTNGSGILSVKVDYSTTSENTETGSLTLVDGTTGRYRSEAFEVGGENGWTQGNHTLTFTVQDKAGHTNTSTKQIIIDNGAPAATLITPSNDEKDVQTGIITLSGTANDEYSAVTDVRYLVLNNNYYDGEDGKGTLKSNVSDLVRTEITKEGYKCFNSGSNNTWKFTLDGLVQVDEKKNPLLPYDETTLEDYSKVPRDEKDILTMRVYIYAKDDLGNESVNGFDFKYNPFGDRPQADVTFPIGTEGSEANVNGSIRITGSAQDNVSVKEVFVQIDMNKDGYFTEDDIPLLSELKDNENQIYQIITDTEYKTGEAINADLSAIGDEGFWGIKANGTNSWNLTVNQYGEMMAESNKSDDKEGQYKINIRAVAVDNNYKFGKWSDTQFVIIDNNIPTIGKQAKNIKEYDDNNYVTATKSYVTDMYVKGKANLEISVEDINGIKQVMYYIATTEEGLATAAGKKCDLSEAEQTFTGGTKGYILEIPLTEDKNSSGTKFVKVVAMKNSDTETTAYEKFSVNFDNSAPQINDITLNGVKYSDSDKKIVNSNGTYFTLGGSVKDDGGSGFDKVLFYYYREGKTQNRIYDVMIDSTDSSNKDAGRINIDESSIKSRNLGGQVVYGTEQSVTINSDKRTFNIEKNKHIRAGGVVEINGTWLTIEKIENDGTTVTLKSDAPDTGSQKVFFAYAQVIDNTGSEKTDANGDLFEGSGDDGDGMAESIIKSLNTWTYDATFHSNYIPDGPGKLVIIAFDKAGNVTGTSYEASVQNNAPRLTRVMLATDLNGNGKYEYYSDSTGPINDMSEGATANGTEYGEFAFYSTLNNKGEGSNIATVTLPAGRDPFVAKNNLLVVPEFTGGNGELSYTYQIVDNLANAGIKTISEGEWKSTKKFAEASKIVNKEGTKVNFDSSQSKEFEITNGVLEGYESWTSAKKSTIYLAATFWDSTEETTPGKDSCYALLKMPLIINVVDDTKPTASIKPFYWNSKEDSSFVYDDDGNPLGHIDIPAENSTDNPGVSGEVYIEGYAWDDTRLGELLITAPDGTEKKVASYKDGIWSTVIDGRPDNWKSFEILEDFGIRQSGHTVKWRFRIDMTPYGLDKDKSVIVKAKDSQNNEMSNFNTEYTINNVTRTPTYIMDFVPYIKSIYSEDIGYANRSRLGKFPVRAGANMIIEGMNFASGATYKVKFYKSNKLINGKIPENTAADSTENATFVSDGKIRVTAPQYSRWVEVVVTPTDGTAVSTKNNSNTNGGYNIEAGYIAKDTDLGAAKAASAGTNFWTDDRYISVWSVATSTLFPGSINPHSGAIKKIDKYNSGSGSPSTVDGSMVAQGPGGGYLYKQNGQDKAVDPVTSMNDSFYAAISSDDLKLYGYVSGKSYTGHGDNIGFASSEVAYVAPVDEMDYTIINGTPYYVIQDNGLGGDSGSVWGLGLCLIREGIWYDREYFNPYKGNTIEEEKLPFFIERQGYNTASHKRDSSTGYDSILYQFKNPRIAGWYNENDSLLYSSANGGKSVNGVDYIYVSYYDSYAKCLKYAGFRAGHRFASNDSKLVTSDLKDWGKIDMSDNIDIVAEMTSSPNRKKGNANPANSNQPAQKDFDHMTDGATVIAGNETTSNNPTYTEIAGEWSDIFVDTTSSAEPRPVIVYYNKTNKSLEVAYGNNSFPQATAEWTKTTSIRPNGVAADFGRYVSAAMDKNGNLHVAAQDADNAKLYYLYLTKSGSSYSVTNSVAVDASNGAGRWTDIELTDPEGTSLKAIKPVISYIDTSYLGTTSGIKVAYLDDEVDGSLSFEAITDPAYYTAGDQRTSVMSNVKETKGASKKSPVAVGFNSDMYAVDFLRGED